MSEPGVAAGLPVGRPAPNQPQHHLSSARLADRRRFETPERHATLETRSQSAGARGSSGRGGGAGRAAAAGGAGGATAAGGAGGAAAGEGTGGGKAGGGDSARRAGRVTARPPRARATGSWTAGELAGRGGAVGPATAGAGCPESPVARATAAAPSAPASARPVPRRRRRPAGLEAPSSGGSARAGSAAVSSPGGVTTQPVASHSTVSARPSARSTAASGPCGRASCEAREARRLPPSGTDAGGRGTGRTQPPYARPL